MAPDHLAPADRPADRRFDYTPLGLYGMLVPQANTVVEPEFGVLNDPAMGMLTARLVHDHPDIRERLCRYFDRLGETIARFANAPIDAVAVGCTGASYLVGAEREDALVAEHSARAPVITAALAVCECLTLLGARRIALVSPYPAWLTEASRTYWPARGFTVTDVQSLSAGDGVFHPIYTIPGGWTVDAVARAQAMDVDAVLVLGTGLPSLHALAARNRDGLPPVLACNLCLAAVTDATLRGTPPSARTVRQDWLADTAPWRRRLAARDSLIASATRQRETTP